MVGEGKNRRGGCLLPNDIERGPGTEGGTAPEELKCAVPLRRKGNLN